MLTAVPPPPKQKNKKEKGIKFAYQLVVTFGHITFRRTARVFPILTGPLHRQRAVAAEGVDEAGCTSQHITRTISDHQRFRFDICIIQLAARVAPSTAFR